MGKTIMNAKCDCGHFWTEHDRYGCWHEDCTRIDREHYFDKATRTAKVGQPSAA